MSTVGDRHAELSSDEFRQFCFALNSLQPDQDARPGFDGMSGGFRFSDEIAEQFRSLDGETLLRLVGWLRCLWGYRISLVLETPRSELADYWFATQHLAPNWPGFLPERCDNRMRPFAASCTARSHELVRGLDRLDAEFRLRQSSQPGA